MCEKYLSKVGKKTTTKNHVQCVWEMHLKVLNQLKIAKYDKIYVDLNDDQYCIDLRQKISNL